MNGIENDRVLGQIALRNGNLCIDKMTFVSHILVTIAWPICAGENMGWGTGTGTGARSQQQPFCVPFLFALVHLVCHFGGLIARNECDDFGDG